MNVKPSLFKQRKCYALIWESETDFEISLLAEDNKQLEKVLEGMIKQISVEDPEKLNRTVRFGVYVGTYIQSFFKVDPEQPGTLRDLAPELESDLPLIFKDVFRNVDLIERYREDGNV